MTTSKEVAHPMYETIRTAAESRMSGDSSGAWKLADALLAEVPNAGMSSGHNQYSEVGGDVSTDLARIADRLSEDGIETPIGNPYTPPGLRELRAVAMAWPAEERLPSAAFRTHQEAGASPFKHEALYALDNAARARVWIKPMFEHGTVADESWDKAIASVQRKQESGTRYVVSANDLRLVLARKVNTPPRDPGHGSVIDAIEEVQIGAEHIERGIISLNVEGLHLGDQREALEGLVDRLTSLVGWLNTLVHDGGMVTDAALEHLTGGQS